MRSLVSRAMPGPWDKATEIYARDAFLTALDDNELRRRIMMACPPPDTLSAVFDLAVRAIAVDTSFRQHSSGNTWADEHSLEKRSKFTRVLTNQPAQCSTVSEDYVRRSEFQQLIDNNQKLLNELELCRDQLARVEAVKTELPAESLLPPNQLASAAQGETRNTTRRSSKNIGFDVCRKCNQ